MTPTAASYDFFRKAATPLEVGTFQWPWDIASKGGHYFSDHGGVLDTLTSSGRAVTNSPSGANAASAVAANPTSSAATDQVLNNELFGPALDSVKADQLLRTVYIGWAGGAQVALFGGGGGAGVAYDELDHGNRRAVTYGAFAVGIGGQVTTGLLVGAMSREPGDLNSGICLYQFGAALVGIGVLVSVVMNDADLSLIGFTINLGVGGGFSSGTGYGKIST
ncbi:hypothetical protein [Geodermatophilus sp. URMC 64]